MKKALTVFLMVIMTATLLTACSLNPLVGTWSTTIDGAEGQMILDYLAGISRHRDFVQPHSAGYAGPEAAAITLKATAHGKANAPFFMRCPGKPVPPHPLKAGVSNVLCGIKTAAAIG